MANRITVVSNERKREILDSAGSQMFAVVFEKADGTERHMQCKKFVERMLASGDKTKIGKSSTAHKPNLYTVCDIGQADAFRSINLDKLKSATIAGVTYTFNASK